MKKRIFHIALGVTLLAVLAVAYTQVSDLYKIKRLQAERIAQLEPFETLVLERKLKESDNNCRKLGQNCIFYLFDDEQTCAAYWLRPGYMALACEKGGNLSLYLEAESQGTHGGKPISAQPEPELPKDHYRI